MTTALISSQLELLRLRTGTQSRVVTCMTVLKRMLYKYQGHVSAALVLGGVDATGPHLYTIYPHGSTDKLPFVTMGSGSLAAMSVFESGYKDGMTEAEAKKAFLCRVRKVGMQRTKLIELGLPITVLADEIQLVAYNEAMTWLEEIKSWEAA